MKTTDAYQINLETIASYRRILVEDGEVDQDSNSILIIVGRKDTSGLEAQIRGSRYAWDIRIITVEALVRLMGLRETLDDPGTVSQISGILIPKEYTKLDDIIDLVFDTAEEVATADEPVQEEDSSGKDGQQHHPKFTPAKFHDACIDRIEKHSQASFIKESRTVYRAPTQNIRVLVSVSRDHGAKPTSNYWFAFHPYQKEQLQEAKEAFVAFGCGSAEKIFLVPLQVLENHLQYSWITERDGRMYWHVRIRQRDGKHHWALKKGEKNIAIDKYLLP